MEGPWLKHPKNPIVKGNRHLSRPAGRLVEYNGKLVRYAQNDYPDYGLMVYAFEVLEITETDYREQRLEYPVLFPSGEDWNASGMHHISPYEVGKGEWIAAADGWSHKNVGYKRSFYQTIKTFLRIYYPSINRF